jgi:hypothetical protein
MTQLTTLVLYTSNLSNESPRYYIGTSTTNVLGENKCIILIVALCMRRVQDVVSLPPKSQMDPGTFRHTTLCICQS